MVKIYFLMAASVLISCEAQHINKDNEALLKLFRGDADTIQYDKVKGIRYSFTKEQLLKYFFYGDTNRLSFKRYEGDGYGESLHDTNKYYMTDNKIWAKWKIIKPDYYIIYYIGSGIYLNRFTFSDEITLGMLRVYDRSFNLRDSLEVDRLENSAGSYIQKATYNFKNGKIFVYGANEKDPWVLYVRLYAINPKTLKFELLQEQKIKENFYGIDNDEDITPYLREVGWEKEFYE